MNIEDFNYDLPEELIAQVPAEKREDARLMVVFCKEEKLVHCYFRDLPDFFKRGDVLIFNDTKVIPARLKGVKSTGGKVEILLVRQIKENLWKVLIKPGKRIKAGDVLQFGNRLKGVIKEAVPAGCSIEFICSGDFKKILEEIGEVPLPPYIKRQGPPGINDRIRYQTVYARKDGAVAAPTAGLHFSEELMREIAGKGVELFTITLHIGPGSFRPIRTSDISLHKMDMEYAEVPGDILNKIMAARRSYKKVIAVGTSTVRALESAAGIPGFKEGGFWADLYIYPGYKFKTIDGLITNFHLPKSTPLLLTCAFAGRELILKAYAQAIEKGYRFLSYGDAMLILS